MIGCWFMSCMTDEILKKIIEFDVTRETWIKNEKNYASSSGARMV